MIISDRCFWAFGFLLLLGFGLLSLLSFYRFWAFGLLYIVYVIYISDVYFIYRNSSVYVDFQIFINGDFRYYYSSHYFYYYVNRGVTVSLQYIKNTRLNVLNRFMDGLYLIECVRTLI